MDAELAPSEGRGDRCGSQGGRRAKLHPRDGSRSDRKSEPGRRAAAVRHRPDEGRPQQGSDHDDGTRGDWQATDGLTHGRVCEFERIGSFESAKTLGLTVAPTLLARADEVIEWKGATSSRCSAARRRGRCQLTLCAMRQTTDEKPGQDDRRAVERQATAQLTTLTSLLAGFGFLWFTSLVDK